jgi:NAD(P)-dependent dehydrogenase (short-subunit alcohol dehydrogenase family)
MTLLERPGRRRGQVAVVTGGGGGIGTAVALELARRGVAVVAMDPGVGVQGEPLNEPTAAQTAKQIAAEGGTARASTASVTDRDAVRSLFSDVIGEFGSLDIVVNTAGILRFASFPQASEDDWRAIIDVHVNGYLNVLAEALPVMEEAGYGRIVGVTSGVGLARAAAASAHYNCAKRAVAAVTWELAGILPEGVALNAISPLAATRMVTGAGQTGGGGGTIDLSAMPAPQDMAPLAAYLASEQAGSCRGQVIFSAGPELSVISPPRLTEAVRTAHTVDFAASLDTLVPVILGPAQAQQRSTGGSNARLGDVFDRPGTSGPATSLGSPPRNCLVISDNAAIAGAIAPALARCGLAAVDIAARPTASGPYAGMLADFAAAEEAVGRAADAVAGVDAIVIAPGLFAGDTAPESWQEMLAGYTAMADCVMSHAGWLSAAARLAVRTSRPLRVVHLADATSPPLRAAGQVVAHLARCAGLARPGLIDVFSIALETAEPADHQPVAQLIARMLWSDDAAALRGAEVVARPGWIGLRSHPGPVATASFGRPALPPWIGDWLRESVQSTPVRL